MAKRNYLVEGLSGVGKSSVYDELIRRGYTAISARLGLCPRMTPEEYDWGAVDSSLEL